MIGTFNPLDLSPRQSRNQALSIKELMTGSAAIETPRRAQLRGNVHENATADGMPFADTLENRLFSATAAVKVWTARVAMHLDREKRDRLFRQIDVLHSSDEWFDEDHPVNLESYKSLVRSILYQRINSRPALSLMPSGNVMAVWEEKADRLTIEFLPGNRARWTLRWQIDGQTERGGGTTSIERLRAVLAPYCASRWFDGS